MPRFHYAFGWVLYVHALFTEGSASTDCVWRVPVPPGDWTT